jgi:uncharacterized C2H2 Zn-finger protein
MPGEPLDQVAAFLPAVDPAAFAAALDVAADAAEGAASYGTYTEYGEEPCDYQRIENWQEVVRSAVETYLIAAARIDAGLPAVAPRIHPCCGCSCDCCSVRHNHGSGDASHTDECIQRTADRYLLNLGPDGDPDGDQTVECRCMKGHHLDAAVRWRGDCPRHGELSAWYGSDRQIAVRAAEAKRAEGLRAAARAIKAKEIVLACPACGDLGRIRGGGCLICEATRDELRALDGAARTTEAEAAARVDTDTTATRSAHGLQAAQAAAAAGEVVRKCPTCGKKAQVRGANCLVCEATPAEVARWLGPAATNRHSTGKHRAA